MDSSRVTVQGDGIRQVAVNRQSFFRVNTQAAGDADLSVRVTCKSDEPALDDDVTVNGNLGMSGDCTLNDVDDVLLLEDGIDASTRL